MIFTRLMAGLLLFFSMPFLYFIGLAIKIKYPGPVFYKQLREGKDGSTFFLWKLRTMVSDANEILAAIIENDKEMAREWQEFGCIRNDPRIAGLIGRFARQLSIDELPQLINVFKGEMAFIGPRPLEIHLAQALQPKSRVIRNSVKPGMTGLWQVGPRSDINIRQMQYYDRLYVQKRNVSLDLYILFKTVKIIFKRTGG
jgi:exopolysaccharide production protein ExoY